MSADKSKAETQRLADWLETHAESIEQINAAAVQAEREACAVTAERAPLAEDFDPSACAAEIAQPIRARKDTHG